MALPTQTISIPLGVGLNTKEDDIASKAPTLSLATDIQFDDVGGLQTRKPFVAVTDHGSNTIGAIQRLAVRDDELIGFTAEGLWSYAEGDGLWTRMSDHLAPTLTEHRRFTATNEQIDGDSATLGGVTMFVWTEVGTVNHAYVAAIDDASGAVKLLPELLQAGAGDIPRVTATSTRLVVTFVSAAAILYTKSYDPAALTTPASNSLTVGVDAYDVVQNNATPTELKVGCTILGGASYQILTIAEDAAPTNLFTRATTVGKACSIAFDTDDDDRIAFAYHNGTSVKCDFINLGGTSHAVDAAVGTCVSPANQISIHFVTPAFGVAWSSGESTGSSDWKSQYNTIEDTAAAGTTVDIVHRCGLASHVFAYAGDAYIWTTFGGVTDTSAGTGGSVTQLQNSYFLYRCKDSLLVAKAVNSVGGGLQPETGHLPSCTLVAGEYRWCATTKDLITLGGGQVGYAARGVTEVRLKMDDDAGRRVQQMGSTAYISGAQVAQYDGQRVVELGFHTYPWTLSIISTSGSNLNGQYNWLQSYSWANAQGDKERSTTAAVHSQQITTNQASIAGVYLHVTAKDDPSPVVMEFWRQIVAATPGQPYYKVSSSDPSATGDNGYLINDLDGGIATTFVDDMTDTVLATKELWPENGGVLLESLAPPAASIIYATADRLLLAGIAGAPHKLAYSKLRGPRTVPSFHEGLTLDLPTRGGAITAIAELNDTTIVFKETSIYATPGDGLDNTGGGAQLGPPRLLVDDVGAVSADSVTLTPAGILFLSKKGWYLLDRGWNAQYVGGPVSDYDSDTFTAVHVVESQHQVRCVSTSRILVWDYSREINAWAVWDESGVKHSVMHNGVQHIVNAAGNVLAQEANWDNNTGAYGLDIATSWIAMGDVAGYQRIRSLLLTGEVKGASALRIRISYDYVEAAVDDKVWLHGQSSGIMQLLHRPSRKKCQAFKLRITARNAGDTDAPTNEGLSLSGLQVNYAIKRGRNRDISPTGKQ